MFILIDLLKTCQRLPTDSRKKTSTLVHTIHHYLGTYERPGYRALGEFAKFNRSNLTNFCGLATNRVPSYSTIRRMMEGINHAYLVVIFNQGAAQVPPENILESWVAIDGKSTRSLVEKSQNYQQKFVSILSVFCQKYKLAFALHKLQSKQWTDSVTVCGGK